MAVGRRDVLKGLTAAMGSAMLPRTAWPGEPQAEKPGFAEAIRGLVRRDGKLMQPIRITLPETSGSGLATTKVDGAEIDHRTLAQGTRSFDVFVEAVSAAHTAQISVTAAGFAQTATVELKPVRKMLVYVLPHSHHDLGYTDLQANVEDKQIQNILRGIALAQKTEAYPEGARFVWNLEVLWGADLFLKRRPESDRVALREAVRKGWIGLNGSYANELTGLCRPEELVELFRFGTQLGKEFETPVRSAMMSDVPGFTWGTVTAMSQAGIRYFSAAPNYFDRIGTFMVAWQDKPFWWKSPSGKERILFWVPWTGYAMSHVNKLGDAWAGKYQDRMDDVSYPYGISYIRWSGHGDNAEPDPELCEWIKGWNTTYEWPKFHIAATEFAFSEFEKAHGTEIPEYSGDLTPYWEDGAASSALETALSRNAAERIVQAAASAVAFHPAAFNVARYNEAWRNVLMYSEHTWGAWNSVSDSENPFVTKQWDVKRMFAVDADQQATALLHESLPATSAAGAEVTVWNTTSWIRTEVVFLSQEISSAGDHVQDHAGTAVPSQRLASGELVVLVEQIAPLSARAYRISHGAAVKPPRPVMVHGTALANSRVSVLLDAQTGDVVELKQKGDSQNFIDTAKGGANQFLYMGGRDLEHLGRSGTANLRTEDAGPLVATIRIESSAPTCNSLVRRVRMLAEADHVLLENTIDKQRAPLNPNPGKGDQASEFAQRGNKESIQFAFPMAVPGGQLSLDVPLAVMRPELDQLPGSDKNWLPVGRWVDVSNAERGVTCATLDAPLVEIGEISATMLGSQRDPSLWRKKIEQTQTFYSWVMNNHWGTNYRAYQQGPVLFRYALRPHGAKQLAENHRFATGLTQPLLATRGGSEKEATASFLKLSSDDVLVQSLKPSDDGRAWIVRLFGYSDQSRDVVLSWHARAGAGRMWISNLSEDELTPVSGPVPVAGQQLVTLRIERVDASGR